MRLLNSDEQRSVWLLILYGFGNASAYVVARTVADSEFLSAIGPDQLPRMYLAAAGVVAAASAIYGRVTRELSARRAAVFTLPALAIASAMLPELIHRYPSSSAALACLYLMAQVRGTLGTIQFTMLLNSQFARRRPERIVGIVGIGSTLAGFLMGVALAQWLAFFDLPALMYLVAIIDLLTIIPVIMLPALTKIVSANSEPVPSLTAPSERIAAPATRQHIWNIGGMVAVSVLAATLVEYQWKVAVAEHFHRDERQMAQYFGMFYGVVFLITGAFQFFVTERILQVRGLLVGLMVFPIALLTTSGAVLTAAAGPMLIWAVTLAKGADTFKRSLTDPCVHVLYSQLSRGDRHQAVTTIAGIVKPVTEAIAAVGLVVMVPLLSTASLSVPVVALVLAWAALNIQVWRGLHGRPKQSD